MYVHIPFCIKKCSYCDFLSAPAAEAVRQAYITQLLREISASARNYAEYQISTIFIGGGTPSILAASQLCRVLEQLRSCFHVQPDAEITVECNPGTLDAEKLRAYQNTGVNRLSIGLQSADEEELRLLGRVHTYEQFYDNYCLARGIGFKNINIDLISALPGQTVSAYERTLRKILDLKPEHISAYSLMIEEGTPFFSRYGEAQHQREMGQEQQLLPDEETEYQMYELTRSMLKDAGYERYEISNYALAGYACRHNIGYWTRQNYLGLGLGASSMVENVRFSNTSDLRNYLHADVHDKDNKNGKDKRKTLSITEQMEEFMFLGLRMMRGISSQEFQRQFSVPIEAVYGSVLEQQIRERLLERLPGAYRLTDYGIDISNYVMAQYLLDQK